jgi:tetratricopeptide (TPR) repeat protein
MASIILQETLAEAKLDAILSARIARARWSLEELRDLYRQTSREDYVQFRMMIARRILEEVKTVQCNSPSPTPEFLEAVFQVGSRLSDAGQYAEALGYLQEAVDAARTLSSVDHVKYIAPLASGLAGLSDALAGLGRSEEALGAQHEAVNLARGIDDGGKVKSEAFARCRATLWMTT